MKTKSKKPSGAANLRKGERVAVLVAMTSDERQAIRVAAAQAGKSMARWMLDAALREIKK